MRMVYLDKMSRKWERCNFKIEYTMNGKIHYYNPDLEIYYRDYVVIEEIKPKCWKNTKEMKLKKEAIEVYCKKMTDYFGTKYKFRIITEDTLFKNGDYNEFKQKAKKLNT